ncbi:hypothetical protein [Jiangella asiatica]|uniref:Uncharacterized protein n=1 Tax=Jiangella asiatica TaxID=2530372 RepID=A0A4R5DBV8_9ACTN|nr:hypothetical protein [Jiangella asiatica]TDE09064.1 hypothetical protein E1269_15195 [Jiangella asiatica]
MIRVIPRRLLIGLFVSWGAASRIFGIVRVAPGDPATVLLGPDADPEQGAARRRPRRRRPTQGGRCGIDGDAGPQVPSSRGSRPCAEWCEGGTAAWADRPMSQCA